MLSLLLAATLLSAGFSSQDQPRKRSTGAPADTDTVVTKMAVISGDSLSGFTEGGTPVQLFIGNVRGVQGSTKLSAGWARRSVEQKRLVLVSGVVVTDGGDTLSADTVHYNEQEKVGTAAGSVRLSDGDATVHATAGVYFIDDKRTVFHQGLELTDSTAVVTGDRGEYWTGSKRLEIAGDVRFDGQDVAMRSDSMTYLRAEDVSLARGSVAVDRVTGEEESRVRTLLFGSWARTDGQAGISDMRGRPLMAQLHRDSSGTDTLFMLADVLTTRDADTLRSLAAMGDVRYWARDMAATADSMYYEERPARGTADTMDRGMILLYGAPVLWTEGTEITGDSMRVVLTGQEVDSLLVWGDAFVAHEDTVLGRINQMRGRMLVACFGADQRRTFKLGPNAEVVYFQRDEGNAPDGAFRVSGDEAVLELAGDEPQQFSFGESQGTYYPESVLEMPLELDGFRWNPGLMPAVTLFMFDKRFIAWMRQEAGS